MAPRTDRDTHLASDLRRSLLAAVDTPTGRVTPQAAAPAQQPEREAMAPAPTPPELLSSSPALQRLCESYHRTHSRMIARSRHQRIGIGMLVSGAAIGAFYLSRVQMLTPTMVSNLVLAIAGASIAGLGVLGLLWVRDDRRLRVAQGERLLRALQTSCDLPFDRLTAFRRQVEPTSAFFDCYGIWRMQHDGMTGIARLLQLLRNGGKRPVTA